MALKRVRYKEAADIFRMSDGAEVGFANDGALVMPLEVVREVSVAHLSNALQRFETYHGGYLESIFISETPAANFDADTASRDVWLYFEQGTLAVSAGFLADPDEIPPATDTASLLAGLLTRYRGAWGGQSTDDHGGGVSVIVNAHLEGARRSVGELWEFGVDMQALLIAAADQDGLDASIALDLVKAGRAGALLGLPESPWLEVKGEPHGLATAGQKWEVAKDVASFANAGGDALIVLGITTRKGPSGDVLDKLRPFPMADMDVEALRKVLIERLVPMIPDLDIGTVEARTGYDYGWIHIPPQPPSLQPFMVTGALSGTAWLGRHVSIPPAPRRTPPISMRPRSTRSWLPAGQACERHRVTKLARRRPPRMTQPRGPPRQRSIPLNTSGVSAKSSRRVPPRSGIAFGGRPRSRRSDAAIQARGRGGARRQRSRQTCGQRIATADAPRLGATGKAKGGKAKRAKIALGSRPRAR